MVRALRLRFSCSFLEVESTIPRSQRCVKNRTCLSSGAGVQRRILARVLTISRLAHGLPPPLPRILSQIRLHNERRHRHSCAQPRPPSTSAHSESFRLRRGYIVRCTSFAFVSFFMCLSLLVASSFFALLSLLFYSPQRKRITLTFLLFHLHRVTSHLAPLRS